MLPRHHPGRLRIAFNDHRLVTNAGLVLPATLGLPQLVDRHLDPGWAPGRANTGDGRFPYNLAANLAQIQV